MADYRLHDFPESGNSYKLAPMLPLCGQRYAPDGHAGLPGWKAPYDLLPGKRLQCFV